MDDQRWLADVEREAGPCPACGASAARPVLYGMPPAEEFARLQGQVVFAGCCLPPVLHPYACAACGTRYGAQRTDGVPGP